MDEKIIDLIELNKDSDGQILPIEKEMILKKLSNISIDVAKEYSDAISANLEDMLVLKNIVSSSDRPHLVKHLIDGLSDKQVTRLQTIITYMTIDASDEDIKKIVNATLGIVLPSPESQSKANKLIELVKVLNIDHETKAKELADVARLIKTFCDLLVVCNMGPGIEAAMRDRLAMISENDLDWLLEIGTKKLVNND